MDSDKTTLIVGSNGAGKSTILDALCFSLYGKPFRNINKPLLINSMNGKECLVEIEFETNGKKYKIVRGLKPAVFEIYINDQLLDQNSKTLEYQDYLTNSILKMTMKSFTQIVILGSASFVPFMQLSPADRRGVIEDLLDIQIFTTMNVLAKQRLQVNKEEYNSINVKLKMLDEMIALLEKNLVKLRANNQEKIESLLVEKATQEKKLDKDQKTIKYFETMIEQANQEITDISALRTKHSQLIQLQAQLKVKHSNHLKDIDFYHDNDTCPVCHQELDTDFKEKSIEKHNQKAHELGAALEVMETKIEALTNDILAIDDKMRIVREYRSNMNTLINLSENTKQTIDYLTSQIETLSKSDELVDEQEQSLKEKQKEKLDFENSKSDNLVERQYLDAAIQLLKDGGIKAKIIKQYLPIINKNINRYLSQMEFFVDFHIDETFKETIKSRFRDEFSYENFSEGEKMRIDLSILFAWRAVARMRNSVHTNLLILDEIFDGSLDGNGVENFLKIMSDNISQSNIFVISHKTDALQDKFDRTIKFEKHKSFSRIAKEIKDNE